MTQDFVDQVKKYVDAGWPIEPFDSSNLFQDQEEINKWIATIPEHLRNRVQDHAGFHPIKLLMLVNPKEFWTDEKLASQNWDKGVGFRAGLTLVQSDSHPGKVQLPIAIDADGNNPKLIETLEQVINEYSLRDIIPIQESPHGGLHLLLCAFVDPNNLDEIELWEKKMSISEGAGCWLNGAKCAIKINCQQVTLFPTPHRKDGAMYKLNKVMPLGNTSWVLNRVIEAFIKDGLLECMPLEYHEKLAEKAKVDSASFKDFDASEWLELTNDEIEKACDIILGTDDFGSIYYDGCRHNNTMPIAGACAWGHISLESTERLFQALCDRVGDDEPDDRIRVVKETYQRIQTDQSVQGRQVLTELFRGAHKHKDMGASANRYEEFRQALGLDHKRIRKNVTVAEFLRCDNWEHVRVHNCMITGIEEAEKMVTKITCTCLHCNNKWEPKLANKRPRFGWEIKDIIQREERSKCPNCNEHGIDVDSKDINALEVEIQDFSSTDDNQQPAHVVLLNDASKDVKDNEEIVITGFINIVSRNGKRLTYLFVGDTEDEGISYIHKSQFNGLTPEDEQEYAAYITENRENILERVASKFVITVLGNEYEKQCLILACNNAAKDSYLKKTRTNTLLIGPPGLAKSLLAHGTVEIVPRSRFISATTTSIRTAIGVMDKQPTGRYIMRNGPIVKASGAVCVYDEFNLMPFEDQKILVNPMQEGRIPFGRYGFTRDLDGSATFILTANPSGGSARWDNNSKDKTGQIPIVGQVLDRIDLILIMEMSRDETQVYEFAGKKLDSYDKHETDREQEIANHLWISKLLLYCKRFNPSLSDDAKLMFRRFYTSITIKENSRSSPRLLDALHNIAVSIAKLKGKDIVDSKDATQAMEIFKKQYRNRISLDLIIPQEPIEVVKEIIIRRIQGTECWYYFNELLTNLHEEEHDIRDYLGEKLVLDKGKNKKFRRLVEWVEGDPRIRLVNKSELKIAWDDSYKDSRGGTRKGSGRPVDSNESQNKPQIEEINQTAVQIAGIEEKEAITGDIVKSNNQNKSNNGSEKSNNGSEIIKVKHESDHGNQNHAQSDLTPILSKNNTSTNIELSHNPKAQKQGHGQIEHDFDYSALQFDYPREQSSISSGPVLAKPVSIEPILPHILVTGVPELVNLVRFDMEWFKDNQENRDKGRVGVIYCFTSLDAKGHKERLHITQFGNSQYDFMVAILEVLSRYDSITGYNILAEESEYHKNSYNSDWPTLRNNFKSVGLGNEFERLESKVRLLDLFRIFKNKALKAALQATGVKFQGESLNAVAKAYVNETKLGGLNGDNIETALPEEQLDYCFQDTRLCMLISSKNNYEIFQLVYNIALDIKADFFDTANAWGTSTWWKYKLEAANYSNYHTDMAWIKSQTFTNEKGQLDTKFMIEGGFVRDPVQGIHLNARTYDFVSLYPNVCIVFKISSETINCNCCKNDPDALIPQAVQDEVDATAKGKRNWNHYWICRKKDTGILSELMRKLLKERVKFAEEGNTFASWAKKIVMNAGYGAFKYVKFTYFDPRVCELITAYGRHVLKTISKLVEDDPNTQLLYGDTDSIFMKGESGLDPSTEAMKRFGIKLKLEKSWLILFLFNEKKAYFGLNLEGELVYKTLVGLKDDKTKFCNDATKNLIRKELAKMFIDNRQEGLKQAVEYVKSVFHELGERIGDLDFVVNELGKTETATKALYEYARDVKQTRAYNEILEDSGGDEELAKSRSQAYKEYTYWKIIEQVPYKTKNGVDKVKKKETTTIYPQKHLSQINIEKYKEELWTSFEPILKVYGLGDKEFKELKQDL